MSNQGIPLIAVLMFAGLSWGAEQERSSAGSKPNFVFILVDDLGYMDVGADNPNTFYETPNVDRLAREGMRFTQGYASPVCSPTRSAIMTGKHPVRTGITDYIGTDNQPNTWKYNTKFLPAPYADRLELSEVTIAEALKQGGYTTFYAGKWHLGPKGYWPQNQGFDINKGGWEAGGPYGGNKYFSPYGNPMLPDGPPGEHLPHRLASETVKFMEANRERPFLAYLAFYSVHAPFMAREDLERKYNDKRSKLKIEGEIWGKDHDRRVRMVQEHAVYAGMVEAMDQAVGEVLAALNRLNLADNTVVIFTSDNGGLSTSQNAPTSNDPLRTGKGFVYEGGIRVPLIVRWPDKIKPASTCNVPVASPDFYPTLLELAALEPRPEQHLDGVSIAPLLRGETIPDRPLFWHFPHYGTQRAVPAAAIRHGDWKLVRLYDEDKTELYNIREDLGEKNDLASRYPDRVKDLSSKLEAWQKQTGAKLPTPNPAWQGQ